TRYALGTLYPTRHSWSHIIHLFDSIQNQLNEEARYARINEQKNTNPAIGLLHLSESFLYELTELSFDWDKNFFDPNKIMEDGCLEDDYEQRQAGLKSLLQPLKREN
ncbi:17595_t:CDS:2, partial [Gigaspora rosea]